MSTAFILPTETISDDMDLLEQELRPLSGDNVLTFDTELLDIPRGDRGFVSHALNDNSSLNIEIKPILQFNVNE